MFYLCNRFEDRITSQEEEINTLTKQMREMKSTNRSLTEDNNTQKREIEKLKISGKAKQTKMFCLKAPGALIFLCTSIKTTTTMAKKIIKKQSASIFENLGNFETKHFFPF